MEVNVNKVVLPRHSNNTRRKENDINKELGSRLIKTSETPEKNVQIKHMQVQ